MAEKPEATANGSHGADEADLAKAFQELAKGERTATALENQLSAMEAKIEALLEQAEQNQRAVEQAKTQQDSDTKDPPASSSA
ncbi:hypothetical protein CB0940_10999 [Cercospora beticola]|uniref:Uncharacterized protein n=1 Tax=Cercospora beticola TaxID=122368 RepID=A0A2G5HDD2_CERBT|nr:hypothetical protein CB0940_10999 [Cercospora beticola]PIA90538.1 hypothetical protein CB0940_10999 [Cercospora beticola]WPB07823.1 hypothetical protein RHO25_012487 [Cercospora beticola]